MNPPGPLGPKAAAVALVMAALNAYSAVPAITDVPAVVVIGACLVVSYGWVMVLDAIVSVVFGGNNPDAA